MTRVVENWYTFLRSSLNDNNINFVAMAVTPWNAISIDALLLSMSEKGIIVKARIAIAEHYSAGYMIGEESFVNDCSEYFKLSHSMDDSSFPRLINGGSSFYSFLSRMKDSNNESGGTVFYSTYNHTIPESILVESLSGFTNRHVIVCYSEEGVGAYMGTFDKTYPRLLQIHTKGEFHSYLRYNLLRRLMYRLYNKKYDSLLFKKTIFGLHVNKSVLKYYRQVFDRRLHLGEMSIEPIQLKDSILICTTAWRRNDIQEDNDVKVLKKVTTKLYQSGHKLVLKTHPRDSVFATFAGDFHCNILYCQNKTLEDVCAIARPKAIISFSSTTLINARIFWGIKSFCLSDLLDRNKISSFYLDEIDSFKRTFKHYCTFVSSIDELIELLN